MDISTIDPTILTISEGAVLSGPAGFSDGEAAVFTVTAADGTAAEWTVIINVQYGIKFTIGTATTILTGRFTDSSDPDAGSGTVTNGYAKLLVIETLPI